MLGAHFVDVVKHLYQLTLSEALALHDGVGLIQLAKGLKRENRFPEERVLFLDDSICCLSFDCQSAPWT